MGAQTRVTLKVVKGSLELDASVRTLFRFGVSCGVVLIDRGEGFPREINVKISKARHSSMVFMLGNVSGCKNGTLGTLDECGLLEYGGQFS